MRPTARLVVILLRPLCVVVIGLVLYLIATQSNKPSNAVGSATADGSTAEPARLLPIERRGLGKPDGPATNAQSLPQDDVDVTGRTYWSAPKNTTTTTVRLLADFSATGVNMPIHFIRDYCQKLAPLPLRDFARPWKTRPMDWGAQGEQTICIRGRTLLTDYSNNRSHPKSTPAAAADGDDDDNDVVSQQTAAAPVVLPKKLKPSQKRIIRHLLQSAPRGPLAPWMLKRHPVYLQDLATPDAFPSLRGRPQGTTAATASEDPLPTSATTPSLAPTTSNDPLSPEQADHGGGGSADQQDAALPNHRLTHDTVSQSAKHKYLVMHRGVGLIAATYLHGFHVLVNTMLPLVHTLLHKYTGNTRTSSFAHSTASKPSAGRTDAAMPLFDFTILRHPYFGDKYVGGERMAYEFATPLATEGPPRILHRADGVEDESVTHCYCAAVLHDMVAAEHMTSLPETRRIAWGDPLRRRSTLFVKTQLNARYGFLPYGTYPIPPTEYAAFGLWTDENVLATTPRLLLLLRNNTRILGDADLVAAMARGAGFNVQMLTPEQEPIALQARAARYADVMLAVHGQALTWSIMMDGTVATHCREVLELQFFGRGLRGMQNVFEVIAADSYLRYFRTPPKEMDFLNASCPDGCRSWRKAMKMARFPQTMKGFSQQRVWFSGSRELQALLPEMYRRVSECIVQNRPVNLSDAYFERSDRSKPNYYKF